jgi:hypothetical protein
VTLCNADNSTLTLAESQISATEQLSWINHTLYRVYNTSKNEPPINYNKYIIYKFIYNYIDYVLSSMEV